MTALEWVVLLVLPVAIFAALAGLDRLERWACGAHRWLNRRDERIHDEFLAWRHPRAQAHRSGRR